MHPTGGSISRTARVSTARWNLKEAEGKTLGRRLVDLSKELKKIDLTFDCEIVIYSKNDCSYMNKCSFLI